MHYQNQVTSKGSKVIVRNCHPNDAVRQQQDKRDPFKYNQISDVNRIITSMDSVTNDNDTL